MLGTLHEKRSARCVARCAHFRAACPLILDHLFVTMVVVVNGDNEAREVAGQVARTETARIRTPEALGVGPWRAGNPSPLPNPPMVAQRRITLVVFDMLRHSNPRRLNGAVQVAVSCCARRCSVGDDS
jgi:hypothetical protein